MKNVLRLIFFTIIPILAGAAVVGYFVTNKQPPQQKPVEERSAHVRIIEVQPTTTVPSVDGFGVVRPAKTWNGISQVGGKVIYVHPDFQKGANLDEGTEIIRLSPSDYDLAIAQAEANIRSSKARLQELAVNEENTKQSLQIERQALTLKETDLKRKQQLLKRGSVAQSSVDNAQSGLLAQRQKVQGMKNTLTLLPTQKSVLEEQIAVYQANLETARLNLARTSIKLPFAARVADVKTEISQYLVPGQSVGAFDGIEKAEIEAQVPMGQFGNMLLAVTAGKKIDQSSPARLSSALADLGLKAAVIFKLGTAPIVWEGEVSRISDSIDPKTRTIGVIVTVSNAYRGLEPGRRPPLAKGMFVEVVISGNAMQDALVVPRTALHGDTIYIAGKDNRLALQKVETVMLQKDIAVIANGLKPGERVVVSALNPAVPGMLLVATRDEELEASIRKQAVGEGAAR